ncbi:peptide-N4-asparagine amidase [Picrophilus oshimae]|uniref:Hypothetical exported protein n=1 Tax=Picrophilus torridus (strain ATCC 700027 / DSM 9790 / JCM 10055 / NBRC 100828 / KAW 2/3) TaxID=1122961 RepID=Q6L2C4_PICTO|nr:peptide-N4-asparagine amidase [Picrophilus oshimae]AAT42878.1 hypothetical exported protein [Picrophilus oshimae DSM 9789]
MKHATMIAIIVSILMIASAFALTGNLNKNETIMAYDEPSVMNITAINNSYVYYNHATSYGRATFPSSFSKVILYYKNTYKSNPWDYSYAITINGIQVASGNTNETENTTVSINITEYAYLFAGKTVNVTANTAEWEKSYSAYQSVWFIVYPGTIPREPNKIIGVFNNTGSYTPKDPVKNILIPYNTSLKRNVTFPDNVTAAFLNLYILQNGNDEFWYSNQPPFREFIISVNNTIIARVFPYPNIQTGGIDLFNWQPIHAIGALMDKPYMVNITPFISILNGTKNINLTIVNNEDQWIRIGLNFLLYTGSNVKSSYNVKFSEVYNYTQNPKTVNESIPSSAEYLNDSQYVLIKYDVSSLNNNEVIYRNLTDKFVASNIEYDPNENILNKYSNGYIINVSELTSMHEIITCDYTTINHGYKDVKMKTSEYSVNLNYGCSILLNDNYQLTGIAIKDTLTQTRDISITNMLYHGYVISSSNMINDDSVYGHDEFAGLINNGVITKMYYNHDNTLRIDIHVYSGIKDNSYEHIEYAVNNSTVNRSGIMVLNIYTRL